MCGAAPAVQIDQYLMVRYENAARRDRAHTHLAIAELLGDPCGGVISLEPVRPGSGGAQLTTGELEDSGAHLGSVAPALKTIAQPGPCSHNPGLVTTEWTKRKRQGVPVDANQNGPGRTTASVYSVRPRAGAPVSTPLRWEELELGPDPAAFTMDAVLDRVAKHGDLFAPVLASPQSLTQALRELGRVH